MKFLVDECLSPELAVMARARGHGGSAHVTRIGKGGAKDWELMPIILAGRWTFVTKNSYDFRGPKHAPGTKGEYRKAALHAGLVCLNGPVGMDLDMQVELFGIALDELAADGNLENQVLEVTLTNRDDTEVTVTRYKLPA
ncbi:MAG: DUF5615 family PIN-like protein [Rhizomicrobium sp.]|jgi:hypothetical protein